MGGGRLPQNSSPLIQRKYGYKKADTAYFFHQGHIRNILGRGNFLDYDTRLSIKSIAANILVSRAAIGGICRVKTPPPVMVVWRSGTTESGSWHSCLVDDADDTQV